MRNIVIKDPKFETQIQIKNEAYQNSIARNQCFARKEKHERFLMDLSFETENQIKNYELTKTTFVCIQINYKL